MKKKPNNVVEFYNYLVNKNKEKTPSDALREHQNSPADNQVERYKTGQKTRHKTGQNTEHNIAKNKVSLSRAAQKQLDQERVKRTLAGDREAFKELFETYRQRGLSVAYGIVRSRSDAEDIVQESFVKAYLALPKYRGQASFSTWFFRIVANMSIDYRRKVSRRGGEPVELKEVILNTSDHLASDVVIGGKSGGKAPDKELETKQDLQRLERGLKELSEEHRAVITLREVQGYSYSEISQMLGVSKGTVMSRLHYARKYLQDALRES